MKFTATMRASSVFPLWGREEATITAGVIDSFFR
jgi:hypothetical protein